MSATRVVSPRLTFWYCPILLVALATLACRPAVGSAEEAVDKKVVAGEKTADKKTAAKKDVAPRKSADKQSSSKDKGGKVKQPLKVDKSQSKPVTKSAKGESVKKVVVGQKAADEKKQAAIKNTVDKKSGDKVAKPVKVDKGNGKEAKQPVKIDKSKSGKVIKSPNGDKKVVVDKQSAVDKKIGAKNAAPEKKQAPVKKVVDKKSSEKIVKPAKVDKGKSTAVKKPTQVDKSKGGKEIKSSKGDKKGSVDKQPAAKKTADGKVTTAVNKGVDKKVAADKQSAVKEKGGTVKSSEKPAAFKKNGKSEQPQTGYSTVNVPKSIELSQDQSEKVAALDQEFAPRMAELIERRNAIISPEQRQAGQEALSAAKDAGKTGRELKEAYAAAVQMTDEQKQQFQDIQTELKELHKTIQGKLNELLTDEQKSQIKNSHSKKVQKGQQKTGRTEKAPEK